eukprot:NODE_803_length_605_cov_333.711297_g794_i0.p1 GENE.NODE_803_length_605_cov_333.711297_g794_i0~~NODE_803_length_605_cov_333.711297_g794_i0.p1  ORF type:complete len:121 (+),score=31.02 NODE_803_length_605_cov_333.711297_g794_i0:57-365(+)
MFSATRRLCGGAATRSLPNFSKGGTVTYPDRSIARTTYKTLYKYNRLFLAQCLAWACVWEYLMENRWNRWWNKIHADRQINFSKLGQEGGFISPDNMDPKFP